MATSHHVHSNSLPSKPHPFTSQFDEHLNRLKSSKLTSTSSCSVGHNLNDLRDMYNSIEKSLQLQLTQQSLPQNQNCIQDLLDGSLMLLDMCNVDKDSLMQTKESTLELQSTLRRRRGDEPEFDEIKKYLNSRKLAKKAIHKALRNLKVNKRGIIDEDHETKGMVNMLKEAEEVTITMFKSLFSFISGSTTQSKLSGWSIVSKLMQSKRVACEKDKADLNEFAKVDVALRPLFGQKKGKSDEILQFRNQLKDLEMCIQDLEEGIELLSRHLIKTRVSMLNILSN